MATCFNENLHIVDCRWPAVARSLRAAPELVTRLVQVGPQSTLQVNGIHLASSRDRHAEAQLQASLVPLNSSVAYVYGPGLGDLPRALLKRKNLLELNVVLMNSAVTRGTFEAFDQRDWLGDLRVKILLAEESTEINFPFAAVPPCLQLAADEAARLRDLVVLELASPYIHQKHGAENIKLQLRLDENRFVFQNDPDIAELFDSAPGASVVVAAAGPTLSESYAQLRQQQPQRLLIAADAALKPLLRAGIRPDFVVSVDAHPELFELFFAGIAPDVLRKITLVYFPTVTPQVISNWPGPRRAAMSNLPVFSDLAKRCPRGMLFCAGSVVHPAVDLAVKLGAARVFLAGADFSFPEGRSHVEGSRAVAFDVASSQDWVFSGDGKKVATTPSLRGYLRDLERYISIQQQVVFQSCSSRGAKIKGAECREVL